MQHNHDNKFNKMDKGSQKSSHSSKHGLMMMLCCLIPILLIAGLPLFGLGGKGEGSSTWLIFILMPLMHVGMMFVGKKRKKGDSSHEDKSKDLDITVEK